MDQMPTMKEWRRLHAEGKLTGAQRLFFLPDKPEEELYDVQADPHEIHNLAGSPKHQDVLKRMRQVLETWRKDTGDLGDIPADKLNELKRPGGQWSVTAAPIVTPPGGTFAGPVAVTLRCPTDGASLAYTIGEGQDARWELYTQALTLTAGAKLRVRACRLGYKDSPEVEVSFQVVPAKR